MCVSLCCITFHPQTQWLKTTTILCTHGCGGGGGGSAVWLGSSEWFFCSFRLGLSDCSCLAVQMGLGGLTHFSRHGGCLSAGCVSPETSLCFFTWFQKQSERGKDNSQPFSSLCLCYICCPISKGKSRGQALSPCGRGRHQGVDRGREAWLCWEPLL